MDLLGHFKYHIYEVKLVGNEDETEYLVTCITRTLRETNTEGEVEQHPFDDLRFARDAFENAVHNVLDKTSFTDVSLYHQQHNFE